jgi:hypothetical protein
MDILPYDLSTTNDLLTSRGGLICIAEMMNKIGFSEAVNKYFPVPQSNRGYRPSVFVNSLILMLQEGGQHALMTCVISVRMKPYACY